MKPRTIGFITAALALILDQANKLWLINVYDIGLHQPVRLAPVFDVIFAKNTGISYSLLSAKTPFGRFALVVGALVVVGLLIVWMWRARTRVTAIGLGLIIGGALGNNACDRFFYGYVADFYHFHVGNFSWYVFNLADVAITFGVVLLLFETLTRDEALRGAEGGTTPENAPKGP